METERSLLLDLERAVREGETRRGARVREILRRLDNIRRAR